MKPPTPPSPLPAAARLADLRGRARRLASHREVGDTVRRLLLNCGIQPWPPAWDLHWDEWIRNHGDERAREALDIFHEAVEKRWEKIKAKRAAAEQEEQRG